MRIWLVQVGEPLPAGPSHGDRPLRTGVLAQVLAARGHEVVWWASTFDHTRKRHTFSPGERLTPYAGLSVRLLSGVAYARNLSFQRLVNHAQLAWAFAREARRGPPPDLVLASLPPVELAAEAVAYGTRAGVPVVVDVRDLWPDALVGALPAPARPLGRLALAPMARAARRALRDAAAVVATSPSYLAWARRVGGRAGGSADRFIPLAYPELPVDPQEIEAAGRTLRERGVDPVRPIAWFIGTFGRTYDLTTVIEAARALSDSPAARVQFVLSGVGERESQLRRAAKGLPSVVFTGWIGPAAISYLRRVTWVGLAPYRPGAPQSLPNKLFEYLSAGLPVLSSLAGDAAQLLEEHECGFTYSPGDSDGLARLILRLVEDPALRARLAERGLAAHRAKFQAEGVYARFAEFLSQVAQSRRPR